MSSRPTISRPRKKRKPSAQTAARTTVRVAYTSNYLLYLPERYAERRKSDWPLVVFLHGLGERGPELDAVKRHGLPRLVEEGRRFPFILASPQCPAGSWWNAAAVDAFVGSICRRLRVDRDRVYLTGLSMGGYGTWAAAALNPNRYAAIVPICGGGEVRLAGNFRNLPVWAFHGAKDKVVRLARSEVMVAAVRRAGGRARLTVFPRVAHNSWSRAYSRVGLFKWLLVQIRQKP